LGTTNTGGRQMMLGAGGFQLGTGGESAFASCGINAELKNGKSFFVGSYTVKRGGIRKGLRFDNYFSHRDENMKPLIWIAISSKIACKCSPMLVI
jgi:hypothetical protein